MDEEEIDLSEVPRATIWTGVGEEFETYDVEDPDYVPALLRGDEVAVIIWQNTKRWGGTGLVQGALTASFTLHALDHTKA